MNPNLEDSAQINHFYRWIRAYLADLSRAADGTLSHAINFGYWTPGCRNLFEAQMAFFGLVRDWLSARPRVFHWARPHSQRSWANSWLGLSRPDSLEPISRSRAATAAEPRMAPIAQER